MNAVCAGHRARDTGGTEVPEESVCRRKKKSSALQLHKWASVSGWTDLFAGVWNPAP